MDDYISKITLDLNCNETPVVLSAGQFDVGRKIEVSVTADGVSYDVSGCTAVCKGHNFAIDCEIDSDNNKVIITTDENMLSVRGMVAARLTISDGTRVYSTQAFTIQVKSAFESDISKAEAYSVLNDLINRVIQITQTGGVLVDTSLNVNSNNPVSNAVLTEILTNKADLTYTSNLLRLSDDTYTKNGVSVEIEDNHVICTGTSTADTNILIPFDYSIISGKKYSFSLHNCTTSVATNGLNTITLANSSGQPLTDSSISQMGTNRICLYGYKSNSLTFTTTSNNTCANLLLYITEGKTLNAEFDLQFEQGDATDYIKPVLLYADKAKSVVDDSVGLSACDSLIKTVITNSKDNQIIDVTPDFKYATKNIYRDYSNNLAEVAANNAVNMFIDCEANTRYVVSGYNFYHGNLLTVTDSQNNILAGYPGVSNGDYYQNIEFVTPDNAARFCINTNINQVKAFKLCKIGDVNPLAGKTLYSEGDSVAYGSGNMVTSYAHYIANKNNMTLTSTAVGGSAFTSGIVSDKTTILERLQAQRSNSYDYILIEGGFNDLFLSAPVGAFVESYANNVTIDNNTFYGALESVCRELNEYHSDSKIVFVLGHKILINSIDTPQNTYWNAIIKVLNKWGIPYIDLRNSGLIGVKNLAQSDVSAELENMTNTYFAKSAGTDYGDGTHPNGEGYRKFYVPVIESALKNNLIPSVNAETYPKSEIDDKLLNKVDKILMDVENIKAYLGYTDEDIAGICVDYQNNTFERLAGACGKTAGEDFDQFAMFGGRKRCNVSDDGTIVAYYGDDDYAEDGSKGQVMVYQPAFWYKVVPVVYDRNTQSGIGYHLRKANYYVSTKPKTGFKLHPAFYDANGNPVDYILMSAFEGILFDSSENAWVEDNTAYIAQTVDTTNDLLGSLANGCQPISYITKPNFEKIAQNRGDGWHLENIKIASANQLLMMIELGTMNTQTAIGQGVVSIYDNVSLNCSSLVGSTDSLGNSTGQAASTVDYRGASQTANGKTSVTYRGVENPWGNIWKHINGINIWGDGTMCGGQPYISDDFNFNESKHDGNYHPVGFTLANTSGYIKAMGYGNEEYDWLLMPSEIGGTSALPVGDYCYIIPNLNSYRIAILGGQWFGGGDVGGFCWNCINGVGVRGRVVGGRLVYVPTAT